MSTSNINLTVSLSPEDLRFPRVAKAVANLLLAMANEPEEPKVPVPEAPPVDEETKTNARPATIEELFVLHPARTQRLLILLREKKSMSLEAACSALNVAPSSIAGLVGPCNARYVNRGFPRPIVPYRYAKKKRIKWGH